jgi:DNA end-binding protein Ku
METIYYPDEIRSISHVPGIPESFTINDKELTMAKLLIEQLSTPFEPSKYTDDYRANMLQAINNKVAGQEIRVAPQQEQTNVLDLMAALQASLDAAKLPPGGVGLDTGAGKSPVAAAPEAAADQPVVKPRKPRTKKPKAEETVS